jgi:hypothetical protein
LFFIFVFVYSYGHILFLLSQIYHFDISLCNLLHFCSFSYTHSIFFYREHNILFVF